MEVAEVLPEFADAFAFEEFNRMQREVLPAVLESDANVVASAPTASGKTAIAELAICRALDRGGTALFVAPLRALTNEKESDWERFEQLGYSVYVVTGERDLNPGRARTADILVMTPEKLDSATRKHDTRRYGFIEDIDLCVVDEVHLLASERRGSALEATVSRLRRLCDPRVVALSATMANVDDVAEWLDAPPEATFSFDDSYRPVDLETGVRTYTHGENSFADKYRRLYRALDLAEPHVEEDGQALVFVASRQDAVRAAEKARDVLAERDVDVGDRGDYEFHQKTDVLENDALRKSVLDGVAFHHAGLSKDDRDRVEKWFREGRIDLLFSTSTLAWGVNLPARCVVIRDTKYHDPLEGEVEMSPIDILQMLGRAGRPGYDDVGYGWVICDGSAADRYRRLLSQGTEIESHLGPRPGEADGPPSDSAESDLAEHLVAEVAMGTIRGLEDVMDWLETTFYYVRAQSAPERYGFESIQERVRETLSAVVDRGFVETDGDLGIEPTPLGRLASRYYLRLSTAEAFREVAESAPDDSDLLRAVATAAEFDDVSARSDEADAVDAVLGSRGEDLDPGPRKVLAILRGAMTGATPGELRSDAWVIRQNALRLLAALGSFCEEFADPRTANLARRVEARVEHGVGDDAVGLTAIDGVGERRARSLATEGYDSPAAIAEADPGALAGADLPPGVVERVQEAAAELPQIDVEWGSFPDRIAPGEKTLREVTVRNDGDGAVAGVRATVNGVEMTADETYLDGATTVPVAVFGADAEELEIAIEVSFPRLPLKPVVESRTVAVRGE